MLQRSLFPVIGLNGEYNYAICSDTFPVKSAQWRTLIERAFGQWNSASNMVQLSRSSSNCVVNSNNPIGMLYSLHNDVNEVFMVDVAAIEFVNHYLHNIPTTLSYCIFFADSCVISSTYTHFSLFPLEIGPKASLELKEGDVDILINRDRVKTSGTTLDFDLSLPSSVQFNSCLNSSGSTSNYELMLHEAGHALGISGFYLPEVIISNNRDAHSTIPNFCYELRQTQSMKTSETMDKLGSKKTVSLTQLIYWLSLPYIRT